ncbi:MAG: homoserine O-acetyltransferase [Planctomycetota bacterium]|nr:homoserine O-acetyltransferase [Planctomycetota bacterium]
MDDVVPIAEASRLGGAQSVGLVETKHFTFAEPPGEMPLECGQKLGPITLAYETYGQLSPACDNAVLIVHALSGDAHAAGWNSPDDSKPGWWDIVIGPGKPFDTTKYFVISSNIIGGCKGSTGPSSTNPATGRPYGLTFPMVTIPDMVRAQKALLEHLGVRRLLSISGGSMGGFQVLEWAVRYPECVASAIPIATCARLSAQGIALNEVGRQAIMADPNWRGGDYYGHDPPAAGLAIARMVGHITYLSDKQMHAKFGRRLQDRKELGFDFKTEFQVESYLRYQGDSFVRRFDANSYLYITKAMDYFDLHGLRGSLVAAFEGVRAEFLVISVSSDWLYPTYQSKEIVKALKANGVPTTFMELASDYGHDAFLVPNEHLAGAITGFLANVQRHVRGNGQGRADG